MTGIGKLNFELKFQNKYFQFFCVGGGVRSPEKNGSMGIPEKDAYDVVV